MKCSKHTGSSWQWTRAQKTHVLKEYLELLRLPSVGSKEKERIIKLPSFHILHLDFGSAFDFELSRSHLSLQGAYFPCYQ